MRRSQVTCLCSAYEFPHRIGGGRCNGDQWAESYFTMVGEMCEFCQSNNEGECDVAGGLEKIKYCEGVKDHLATQTDLRLPKTWEQYYEEIENEEREKSEWQTL